MTRTSEALDYPPAVAYETSGTAVNRLGTAGSGGDPAWLNPRHGDRAPVRESLPAAPANRDALTEGKQHHRQIRCRLADARLRAAFVVCHYTRTIGE